jgi:hypothetical protein
MVSDVLICIIAVAVGIFVPFSLIYLEKLTSFLSKKKEQKGNIVHYKILDMLYGLLLPVVAAFAVYIVPGLLISVYIGDDLIFKKNYLFDLYLIFVSICFFVTLAFLIKKGKLKGYKRD